MPLAYILGKQNFLNKEFFVDKSVLIPRRDTEILVEQVMKHGEKGSSVLDLCTGSGCIAISLGFDFNVTAVDICAMALTVARKNAEHHDVKVNFIQSNMFEHVDTRFDIIVSNPPYIKTQEIGVYDRSILHEPRIALDGGRDGLNFYRIIASQAKNYLNDRGLLALEIGFDQAEDVTRLLEQNDWDNIRVIKDTNDNNRVILAEVKND
ncbi:MAG: peptide chain release factor N(5)-glutamine methyltransferase [Firmicutes bacterium]|nr:peptide chain release factor N(5)-glutamine methyltransferase [Bacillota bacterium]